MDGIDRRRRASEEAAAWFVLLQEEQLTPGEREEFIAWLRESALHVGEMLRIARVHNVLELFGGRDPISPAAFPDNVVPILPNTEFVRTSGLENENGAARAPQSQAGPSAGHAIGAPGARNMRQRLRVLAIAASLGAILLTGLLLLTKSPGKMIQTERGERREVALIDGSLLEIAPESRVRVRFEPYARYVALEQGRAVFRVAKNPTRPFSVLVDGTTILAVGTAFGVERAETGVTVTVADGSVSVVQAKIGEKDGALLKAGEQIVLGPSGVTQPVRAVDSERELAWSKGRLVFDNEPVSRAVALFNRYNRTQIRITDAQLAQRPVSGIFDASDPDSFIAFIQSDAQVRVIRTDAGEITVSKLD